MKTYKFLNKASAAIFLMIVTSCVDDSITEQLGSDIISSTGKTINVVASMPGNNSRMEYGDEGQNSLGMTWSANESFFVYNGGIDNVTTFTIKEGEEGAQSASFEGTPLNDYKTGDKLLAVFNKNQNVVEDVDGNLRINVQNQTGKLDDQFHYMFGSATYEEGVNPVFSFTHLVSIMKMEFNVPVGTNLTQVEISGEGIYPVATLLVSRTPSSVTDDQWQYKLGDVVRILEDHWETGETITINGEFKDEDNDGVLNIYAYIIPVWQYYIYRDNRCLQPQFIATDDKGEKYLSTVVYEKKWIDSAGKMYRVKTPLIPMVDFENEDEADGSAEQPYEIANADQLYSMMLRISKRMMNRNESPASYSHCHYKLTSDIELDDSMIWYPFGFYENVFDGQGHTISGNIRIRNAYNCGFFAAANQNSTIKNLTLDLNISIDNEGYDEGLGRFGGIVSELGGNSQLINCVNKSNITTNVCFEKVGGLAGEVNNSAIIACVNEGDMTFTNPAFIGGLVGNLIDKAKIEACYNIGNITVTSTDEFTKYMGDLIGAINYNSSEALMNACWSNASTTYEGEGVEYGAITGYGSEYVSNCYNVTPDPEQIATMNSAMTNGQYEFGSEGVIVAKSTSSSGTE